MKDSLAHSYAMGCAFLLTLSAPAHAHHIWITTQSEKGQLETQINYGDPDKRELPERSKIVALSLSAGGKTQDLRASLTKATRGGQPTFVTNGIPASAGVLAVVYDNGFWLTQPGDSRETNTSPLLAAKGKGAHWTVKYGKQLLGPGAFEQVLHTRIELVALQDPFTVANGKTLPVRLELDGKPQAGKKITYCDGVEPIPEDKLPTVTTGADGVAQIPITRQGRYLLTADVDAPPAHAALAEHDHLYTSLTFDSSR